eukprot:SAG11_NODE_25658_length_355_cov_230.593750_1_plen_55_part_10
MLPRILGEEGVPEDVRLLRGTQELLVISDEGDVYDIDHIHDWGDPNDDTAYVDKK